MKIWVTVTIIIIPLYFISIPFILKDPSDRGVAYWVFLVGAGVVVLNGVGLIGIILNKVLRDIWRD